MTVEVSVLRKPITSKPYAFIEGINHPVKIILNYSDRVIVTLDASDRHKYKRITSSDCKNNLLALIPADKVKKFIDVDEASEFWAAKETQKLIA